MNELAAARPLPAADRVHDIVIADDHGLVRSCLRQLIENAPDLRVGGEAADGEALLQRLEQGPVDLVLLDMAMPGLSGVDLIRHLLVLHPGLRVLVLSMHNDAQIVTRALTSGACGFVSKDCHPDTLIAALRKVLAGGRYIDPALVESVVFDGTAGSGSPHDQLSPRELQILVMISAGQPLGSIADRLHLSPKTVSTHKMRLMQKLGLQNNADLMKYAVRHGLTQG